MFCLKNSSNKKFLTSLILNFASFSDYCYFVPPMV